ncbi:hypothetical protein RJ640_022458 [Escallonia rubra]|uniref:S1 motif domain-containing protein n=1 Tax=Escallonia rubra TaxID=112253 RepID=A0AA88U9S1_9ASTE|nr:hypothetical protein RJ640_022458 [Escallonia rubra]
MQLAKRLEDLDEVPRIISKCKCHNDIAVVTVFVILLPSLPNLQHHRQHWTLKPPATIITLHSHHSQILLSCSAKLLALVSVAAIEYVFNYLIFDNPPNIFVNLYFSLLPYYLEPHKTIQEIAETLTGSRISVKVIQAAEEKRKLIFSEKEASWSKFSQKINVGDIFEGRVGSVEDYGAFIHLRFSDGRYHLTGLVHVSEVSWDLVQDVRDILTEGDEVRVKVIKIDRFVVVVTGSELHLLGERRGNKNL